jgi:outer membrane protein
MRNMDNYLRRCTKFLTFTWLINYWQASLDWHLLKLQCQNGLCRIIRWQTVLLLLLLGVTPLLQAETLLDVYQLAEQNDPQVKIARAERFAALENLPQARALLSPQVTVGADVSELWMIDDWLLGRDVERTEIGYNISLNYALYRRDRQIQREQVNSLIQQAQANYDSARQALMERVATRYFAVLAANDNVKFAQSAKHAFKRQLDQARQRFEVGLIAITDVQEAQAGYDLAVADEIQAQNELDNTRESLREITGSYHQVLARLNEDSPLLNPDPIHIEKWTETALANNPLILAAQYAVETAEKEIDKQQAAKLPTVDLVGRHHFGTHLRGEKNAPGSLLTDNTLTVQLNYQLYEGGAIHSRIREAKQQHIKALENLELQRRHVQSQTRQAFLALVSNISRVKALKQALISTETALKAIQTGFELGTRTSVDVVNAQRDLLRAQSNHSRARYDYVLSSLRLKQAAGLITGEDLIAINNWLTQHTFELTTDEEESSPLTPETNPLLEVPNNTGEIPNNTSNQSPDTQNPMTEMPLEEMNVEKLPSLEELLKGK